MAIDLTFYEAAAQLLPVLFLALIFEVRSDGRDGPAAEQEPAASPEFRFVSRLIVVALLLLGEALAIRVLLTQDPTFVEWAVVGAALALALAALGARVMVRFLADIKGLSDRSRHRVESGITLLFALLGVLPLLAGTPHP